MYNTLEMYINYIIVGINVNWVVSECDFLSNKVQAFIIIGLLYG